jgi:hypothetical protein
MEANEGRGSQEQAGIEGPQAPHPTLVRGLVFEGAAGGFVEGNAIGNVRGILTKIVHRKLLGINLVSFNSRGIFRRG